MAIYIMAMSISSSARKTHQDLPHHIEESLDMLVTDTIKNLKLYATLGRFDYVATFEGAEQVEIFKIANAINSKGILKTETWPVVPYEDFSQIIQ
ncbi:MAG: GYD domain-containing protein [bacterium]|nr:GYD domain-containing protein [bacterium]